MFDDVMAEAKEAGVAIYTITLRTPSIFAIGPDSRTPPLLRIGILDEGAGAGDWCARLLPLVDHRTGRGLLVDRRRSSPASTRWVTFQRTPGETGCSGRSLCASPPIPAPHRGRDPGTSRLGPSARQQRPSSAAQAGCEQRSRSASATIFPGGLDSRSSRRRLVCPAACRGVVARSTERDDLRNWLPDLSSAA